VHKCLVGSRQCADLLAENNWAEDAGTLRNDSWPLHLAFHSFDPMMAVTDDTDNIWSVATTVSTTWLTAVQYLGLEDPQKGQQILEPERAG
jgi:hypothetical protein